MWFALPVRMLSGLRFLASVVLVLLVAGCSSEGPTDSAKPSPSASPTRNPLIGGPAPSEALAPAPSIVAGDDPQVLLGPGGDTSRLAATVRRSFEVLRSLHVEQQYTSDVDMRISADVDDGLRCSGDGVERGVHFRFVTTSDDRALLTSDQGKLGEALDGRWAESPLALADYCGRGPFGVGLQGIGAGWWAVLDATRIGNEHVSGRSLVHFRKKAEGWTVDTWIAASGAGVRLMKAVVEYPSGNVITSTFSEFNSADPVEPEPPADMVVSPGTSST